ncbi:hypothetical protein HanHA300_Chr01g0019401 [Helianthus annuus]|nr:hypothetical protein HanHA300_Chr01g0019401 [Helianthus annuus]
MMFFFIREEVILTAMLFRERDVINKEDTPIPKKTVWYEKLMALPNRVFGEQVLVAAGMSDKWPEESKEVPVLLFNGKEVALYQVVFKTFGRTMGVMPLRDDEESWYERIIRNLMFTPPESFANPPEPTEGARIPNLRPLRGVTSAGKEIVYLSSEESVASSNHELSTWDDVFVGVLRDLGIDTEQKIPKKTTVKKKFTVAGGATSKKTGTTHAAPDAASKKGTLRFCQSNLEDYVKSLKAAQG